MKKRIIIELDEQVKTELNRIARSKLYRLKPYLELLALNEVKKHKLGHRGSTT